MELKTYFAQDDSGNLITEPTVHVYGVGTKNLVSGLKSATGATLQNPFKGATNGQIQFAAPNGDYDMQVSSDVRSYTMRIRFVDLSEQVNEANAAALRAIEASRLSIGEVTTTKSGGSAAAEITGEPGQQILNLRIPRGEKGDEGAAGPASIGTNLVMNPEFIVNQLGLTGTVTLAADKYGHDGWKAGSSGCTYTFAPDYSSDGNFIITITAGSLMQTITRWEGLNFISGRENMVLSWMGTAQGQFVGSGYGGYGASGVTTNVSRTQSQAIEFGVGTVTKVKLEFGTSPSIFRRRSYAEEMALCRRYLLPVGELIGRAISATAVECVLQIDRPLNNQNPTLICNGVASFVRPAGSSNVASSQSSFLGYLAGSIFKPSATIVLQNFDGLSIGAIGRIYGAQLFLEARN